jgi:hypothetical protein
MTATVFPLYNKFYTLAAYFAVVLLLSALCFGSLKDHLFFTHDNEIQQEYPHLTADPAFFVFTEQSHRLLTLDRRVGELGCLRGLGDILHFTTCSPSCATY